MPDSVRERAMHDIVTFAPGLEIAAGALDRAIAGGIRRGSEGAARADDHEDLGSRVKVIISRHVAEDRPITGKLSSFAFGVARRVAYREFSRMRGDILERQRRGAGVMPDHAADQGGAESAEARMLRRSERALRERLLRKGLSNISADDRAALAGMISRTGPAPRGTPEEIRAANRDASAEKRARSRLGRAVRAARNEMEI